MTSIILKITTEKPQDHSDDESKIKGYMLESDSDSSSDSEETNADNQSDDDLTAIPSFHEEPAP